MGLLDELKKLTRPYSGDEYDDFGEELPETPAETRVPVAEASKKYAAPSERRSNPFSSDYDSRPVTPVSTRRDKVVNLTNSAPVQVVLVKPERFEAAAEIADHLRDKRPVLMNLEQTQKDTARRLLDFLSGVAYALDGKIRKIASNTYIITPYNVDIMGDLMDELETGGNIGSGLYL